MPYIQFQIKDQSLYEKLMRDVALSAYPTRAAYVLGAIERLLSRPLVPENVFPESACAIEQFIYIDELFHSLPVSVIANLAKTQNRDYAQMKRHLIDIALLHYRGAANLDLAAAENHKELDKDSSLIIPSRLL